MRWKSVIYSQATASPLILYSFSGVNLRLRLRVNYDLSIGIAPRAHTHDHNLNGKAAIARNSRATVSLRNVISFGLMRPHRFRHWWRRRRNIISKFHRIDDMLTHSCTHTLCASAHRPSIPRRPHSPSHSLQIEMIVS